ncbi:MAG: 3-oxoacyl-[acyl-carrier-protein] reductase [Alphaproteobacteria bacterium]|nr:3-oxoacyl-[acyl-carrier-protein] reductase [Alphaproteobacteria bacterium]
MFNLSGRLALVTGASSGIGAAIAEMLAAQGARVALSGTRVDALEATAARIDGASVILPCNLSDAAATAGLVGQAEEALGGLDILVSNAGFTRDGLLLRMKDEDWESVLNVNLGAYFRLARAAMRGMMKRRHGRIIGITSVVGVTGNAGQTNYAASKAGMIGFTKSLAAEVASRNITVNCVAPGFIATPMTDALKDDQKAGLLKTIPAGRLGSGADIAAAVVYLASDESAYITGQTLHVNGGMAMI